MPHSFRLVNIILRLAIPYNSCEILSETKIATESETIMKFYLICRTPQKQKFYVYLKNVENGVVTIAFSKTILHAEAFTAKEMTHYYSVIKRQYPDHIVCADNADTGFDFRTLLAS